jgi:Spy/CpxP family protein refolding chaperone
MKIWILIFSAALFVGGTCLGVALQPKIVPPAVSQPKTAPENPWSTGHRPPPYISVSRFSEDLQLSDEQNRELDAIMSESQDETQALGRAMRAAQDKSRQRITDILTPDQKKKLDELMSAERQKRSDGETARLVASYQKILGLNDEQAASMRTILTDARKLRHEVKPGGDWRQSRKDARDQQNKSLEKAFTPEQYKRYLEVSELERFDR